MKLRHTFLLDSVPSVGGASIGFGSVRNVKENQCFNNNSLYYPTLLRRVQINECKYHNICKYLSHSSDHAKD